VTWRVYGRGGRCERHVCLLRTILPVLDEADRCGFFAEALTAEVETVFADETCLVGTETALTAAFAVFAWAGEPDCVVRPSVRLTICINSFMENTFFFCDLLS